jgi:hypothetical protein
MGEMEFTGDSIIDTFRVHLDFFDRYLKQTTDRFEHPQVKLYVTGCNAWREFDAYPVPGVRTTNLYLSSHGSANSLFGDGGLIAASPDDEPQDHRPPEPRAVHRELAELLDSNASAVATSIVSSCENAAGICDCTENVSVASCGNSSGFESAMLLSLLEGEGCTLLPINATLGRGGSKNTQPTRVPFPGAGPRKWSGSLRFCNSR